MSTFNEEIAEIKRATRDLLAAFEPTIIGHLYRTYIRLLDKLEAWLEAQEEEHE